MPWKDSSVMDQRYAFVLCVLREHLSISEACRSFGISRPTGYSLVARFQAEGLPGLIDRSRAPHTHAHAVCEDVRDCVLALRVQRPSWGPKKIKASLGSRYPDRAWPAASTIGEILKQSGHVSSRRPRPRKPAACDLTQPFTANQVWSADFKGEFPLANGRQLCYPLTLADVSTRYLLRCQGLSGTSSELAQPVFAFAFEEFGLPTIIRTDNGEPFASVGLTGLSRLSLWWIKLGIIPERIAPGCPQQNGRHERMHRTLKAEAAQPPAATPRAQQTQFDRFRQTYNVERPHEGIGLVTPAAIYKPSERPYPRPLPKLTYTSDMTLRIVRPSAAIRWRGKELYISKVLIGEHVGLDLIADKLLALYVGFWPMAILNEEKMAFLSATQAITYLRPLRQEAQLLIANV